MDVPNIGLLFYKDYYEEYYKNFQLYSKDEEQSKIYFEEKNKKILDSELLNGENCISIGNCNLFFKTTYPGLLVGSGYTHGVDEKNEFKMGFYFDYTTGLPIIPGSSVKGILKSVFNNTRDENNEYIKEIIKSNNKIFHNINVEALSQNDFLNIEKEIFEGIKDEEPLPVYKRDIFFDAIIDFERTEKENSKGKKILGDDFITHHENPLKNPVPLKFLKVLPNVVWKFQFDLKEGNSIFNVEQKLFLFRNIILDMGVGSKTNVGYGRFDNKYGQEDLEQYLRRKEIELQKRIEEEENEKLQSMTELQKKIYVIEKQKIDSLPEETLSKLFNEIDSYNEEDKIEAALFLKRIWIKLNKWQDAEHKVKVSTKQAKKIEKIKLILKEK